ncbi:MAG: DUF3011 domain-containing protein [Pseudomonadota bacterium]
MLKTLKTVFGKTSIRMMMGIFFGATMGFSQALSPVCMERQNDSYTLRFQDEEILSRSGPERLALKRMLMDACQVRASDLDTIQSVTVVGSSLNLRPTAVWLEGDSYRSSPQYLTSRGYDRRNRNDQVQFQLMAPTFGRLQVVLQGEVRLAAIRVKLGRTIYPNPGNPTEPTQVYRVTCESHNFAPNSCYVPGLKSVRLVRTLSSSACIQGMSYFVNRDEINVTRGCRAEFEVTASNYRPR